MTSKHTPGPWVVNFNDAIEGPEGAICRMETYEHSDDDALLICAAPDLLEAGKGQTDIIREAQSILTRYLSPIGPSTGEAISDLLELFDGPAQRDAQAAWDAAIAKAEGRT